MTSNETNNSHQKHAQLNPPALGSFGRNEIAIAGTSCANIRNLAYSVIRQFTPFKIAYVDADHKSIEETEIVPDTALANGAFIEYTDKITFQRVDLTNGINDFQKRMIFNEQDLIIVNGNHFSAQCQIAVVNPDKNLEKKLEKLTDLRLILLKETNSTVPQFLQKLPGFNDIPILSLDDENGIMNFFRKFFSERIPPLHGLVLSGGQSSRMKKDKGSLNYHGMSQREYLYGLMSKYCEKTFISCNSKQAEEIAGLFPIIEDRFLNLGPMGGILSALLLDPNAAWLTIACDLPYLSETTIEYLVKNRNTFKTATAFLDPDGAFPEPLITIWEPKSYSLLLQFLAQGYACPRKVLINSDTQLLKAPDVNEFLNANFPEQYEDALRDLKKQ